MLLQAAESWVLPLAFVCCCVGEGVRQRGSSMGPTGAVKAESVYRLAHSPEAQSVLPGWYSQHLLGDDIIKY